MQLRSIVAGVDGSAASIEAASLAWDLAEQSGAQCYLVHATTLLPRSVPWVVDTSADDAHTMVVEAARDRIGKALRYHLPAEAIDALQIRIGRAAWVLPRVADECGADLLVLGGKTHSGVVRLLGGSSAHHAVRSLERPLLVTGPTGRSITRILAAVDAAAGSESVLAHAAMIARLTGATLSAIHAIEPLPRFVGAGAVFDYAAYETQSRQVFEDVMTAIAPDLEYHVVVGTPEAVIRAEAETQHADLVVVGSHGKGFIDRWLVGSATHALLTELPTALYVVPVASTILASREPESATAGAALPKG